MKYIVFASLMTVGAFASVCHPNYECCQGCEVSYVDNEAQWGVENGNWCVIEQSKCGNNNVNQNWNQQNNNVDLNQQNQNNQDWNQQNQPVNTFVNDGSVPVISLISSSGTTDFATKPVSKHISSQMFNSSNAPEPYFEDCIITVQDTDGSKNLDGVKGKVKVRGNWTSNYPKKPLRITFEEDQNVLGLHGGEKFKNWVLLAEYKDGSMLRNKSTFSFSRDILNPDGLYASDSKLVELKINDEYFGVYLLAELQQVSPKRVKVSKVEDNYTGTDIGYFLELDFGYSQYEEGLQSLIINYNNNAPLTPYDGQGGQGKSITPIPQNNGFGGNFGNFGGNFGNFGNFQPGQQGQQGQQQPIQPGQQQNGQQQNWQQPPDQQQNNQQQNNQQQNNQQPPDQQQNNQQQNWQQQNNQQQNWQQQPDQQNWQQQNGQPQFQSPFQQGGQPQFQQGPPQFQQTGQPQQNGQYNAGPFVFKRQFQQGNGENMTIKSDINSQEQHDFISNFVNGVYTIMYEAAYNKKPMKFDATYSSLVEAPELTPREAVENVVDTDSLADLFIINEMACDADLYYSSFYMDVDFGATGDKKLRFEAPWDFDSGLGNKERCSNGEGHYAANITPDNDGFNNRINAWLAVLMYEDWYQDLIKSKWTKAYDNGVFGRVIDMVNSDSITHEDAFIRNYDKWNNIIDNKDIVMELSAPAKQCRTEKEAASYLASWLENRTAFVNNHWHS